MALEIKLAQKLSQSLLMTPQLQQAIKLLQLGRLEYQEAIEKELLENPILEEIREEPEVKKEVEKDLRESEEAPIAPQKGESPVEWDDYLANFSDYRTTHFNNDPDEQPSYEANLTKQKDLADHIISQLCVTELNRTGKEILLQIVGNLDNNGYLCISNQEIAEACNCTEEEVLEVLELVQSLDPAGLAAHDLQECLLLQLGRLGLQDNIASKIVKDHLQRLEKRQYEQIAKIENVKIEDVYKGVKIIRRLNPYPGKQYSLNDTHYVVPDIFIIKDGNDYVVSLNEEGIPKLRVNPYYLELLNKKSNEANDEESKAYLTDRYKAASWLIKSIHQRQSTIFKVTESIVKFQRDFLDHGVSALKPLVLRDIAADINMHESTISRVTTNKYVHTPQGVFELKYFFTTGLKSEDGSVSSSSVKEKIRTLIQAEKPEDPISDQQIVDILTKENINIARRTVAKYRESLGILSSSKRRKAF